MASPFSIFRRNQKVLLSIVGLLAMVAFVFLDPLMRYVGGGNSRQQNPVVVETNYGPLTESDLVNVRNSRELVEIFLRNVTGTIVQEQVQKGALDPRRQEQFAEQFYNAWRQRLLLRSKPGPEEAAIETLILSRKAQQMGIVVSDRAINDLIKEITADALPADTIQGIIANLQPGRRVSLARFFEAMRTELMASKFSEIFRISLGDITPAQRFEYFSRLSRRAKAEVMPLNVADFVGQVPDPSEEQLVAFYEEHKNRLPDPLSPDPGFKQAKRAQFQYFKADFAALKEEFKPKVTDEEIAEYYEKNKAQFRAIELPAENKEAAPAESGDAGDAVKPTEEKPAEGKPADEKPAEEKAEEKPAEPAADKPAEEPQKEEAPKSSASLPGGAKIRLVSTADEEKPLELAAPENAPADKPAEDAKPAEEAKPAAEGEAKAADAPADADAAKPAEGEAATEKPAEEIKYEPLEKVKESIRDSIAGQKAGKQINEIFETLSAAMRNHVDDVDRYNANKGTDATAKPPKPFPFEELAKQHNVQARETDLITAQEAAGTDLGKISRTVQDRRAQFGFRVEPFNDFAFADSLKTFMPAAGEDNDGNAYLFWKIKEEAAYVPPLEQIRDKVTLAWKMIKARDLATKRGDEYAVQAKASKKSLKETFAAQPNLKVSETNAFSWLTTGNVPMDPFNSQPRMSQVENVENVGQAFMEKVFSLSPGDVGVTINHPKDIVYVVRLIEYEPSIDELRKEFAAENRMRYMSVASNDQYQVYAAWLEDLNKDAGVKWKRQADLVARRQAGGEAPIDDSDE